MISRFLRFFSNTGNQDNQKVKSFFWGPTPGVVNNLNVPTWLNPAAAFSFYRTLSPLADAIDRITQEVAGITPLIFNKMDDSFIKDHPLLDLLHKPNTNLTYHDFIVEFVTSFLATGNGFLVDTFRPGKTEEPPLEIFNVYPQDISIIPSGYDGYPGQYQKTGTFDQEKFFRYYRGFRFLDNEDAKQATKEIYQIKKFNANSSGDQRLWGMPESLQAYYELQQFLYSSVHNLSQLQKGARPSGVITFENGVTDEQFQRLQQQVNLFYQGAQNSGNIMMLDGSNPKFTPTSQNNKDMDFDNLSKSVITRIYNKFKIPLPLINPDSMTLSNYNTAILAMYDQAVLPIARFIFSHLTNFLVFRYPDLQDCILGFDPRSITALQPRHTEEISNLQKLNIMMPNEIRNLIKLDPLGEGANILYQPTTLGPIAAEAGKPQPELRAVNPVPAAPNLPSSEVQPKPEDAQGAKARFVAICRRQKDSAGQRVYSDLEIDEIWKNSKV